MGEGTISGVATLSRGTTSGVRLYKTVRNLRCVLVLGGVGVVVGMVIIRAGSGGREPSKVTRWWRA